jgi:hypothetical protein
MKEFFSNKTLVAQEDLFDRLDSANITTLRANLPALDTGYAKYNGDIKKYLAGTFTTIYRPVIRKSGLPEDKMYYLGGDSMLRNFPQWLFAIIAVLFTILTFVRNYSLIPVLGLVSCFYLMAQENHTNWLRFLIWLVIGLVIYFFYSKNNSKLNPGSKRIATG